MSNFEEYKLALDARLAEYRLRRTQVREEKAALREAEDDLAALREALAIAQGVAADVQEQAHKRIADVVTRSLAAIFDEPYTFKIHFEQKRGRTEARLEFVRDGVGIDPMGAAGGGPVDVAAFALRLSCLLLAQPPRRRLLVLDEPWKFLSAEYRPRMRALVEKMADDLGCQFVIVTHDDSFKMGTIVEL